MHNNKRTTQHNAQKDSKRKRKDEINSTQKISKSEKTGFCNQKLSRPLKLTGAPKKHVRTLRTSLTESRSNLIFPLDHSSSAAFAVCASALVNAPEQCPIIAFDKMIGVSASLYF